MVHGYIALEKSIIKTKLFGANYWSRPKSSWLPIYSTVQCKDKMNQDSKWKW